ncbi:MAG: hypothetical protein ACJASR_000113 [Psychroserpens sp.]|jgi:hypothetical protein
MLPNTFILGYPKSGTTALAALLSQHQEIFIPLKKEPRFFQFKDEAPDIHDPVNKNVITSIDDYKSLYYNKDEKILIDASPGYILSSTAIRNIKSSVPNAKIILFLRDPIERAYSHYLFAIQKGFEPDISFKECLDTPERFVGQYKRTTNYVAESQYKLHLTKLFNVFDPNVVYINTTEQFQHNQQEVLQEINEFLDLEHFIYSLDIGEKAKSGIPKSKALNGILKNLKSLRKSLPSFLKTDKMKKIFQNVANSNLSKPEMDLEVKLQLMSKFSEDIEFLKNINVDVSLWRNFNSASN